MDSPAPQADLPATAPAARVGRKASLMLASQLLGAAVGYLTLFFLTRYIDVAAKGTFDFAVGGLGIMVAILGNFGLGEAHVYHVARGTDLAKALGAYVRLRLGMAALLATLVVGGGFVWFVLLGKRLTDSTSIPILGAVLAMQLLSSVRQIAFDTWLGREKVNRTEVAKGLDTALAFLFVAALALAIAASTGRWTPAGAVAPWLADWLGIEAGGWGILEVGLALALAYLLAKTISLVPVAWWWLKDGLHVGPWDRALGRSYLLYAVPIAMAGAISLVQGSTDIVMLGYFESSTEVSQYQVAQKFASAPLIAAIAVGTPLLPRFSNLLKQGLRPQARQLLHDAERYLLLIALPAAVAFAILPQAILHVAASDQYLDAAWPLRLLGAWVVVLTITTPARTKLVAAGRVRATLVSGIVAAVLNVILNLWFIPDRWWGLGMGTFGAALATLLSTLAASVYLRWQLHREFQVPIVDRVLVRMALAALGLAAFWLVAWRTYGPSGFDRFYELGLWGIAGLAVFAGLAALLGMLTREDVRSLWRVASPMGLWRELRGKS